MKVKVRNTNSDAGSVKMSECFWYKGLLYMRVAVNPIISELPNTVYAVLLTTGLLHALNADVQVETVDCSIIATSDIPTEKDKWEV